MTLRAATVTLLLALVVGGTAVWWQTREQQAEETEDISGLQRRAVDLPTLLDSVPWIRIHVEYPDGSPAPAAKIFMETPEPPEPERTEFLRVHPVPALASRLETLGTPLTADERGRLTVTLPGNANFGIAAYRDGAWAAERLRREDFGAGDEIRLMLKPSRELEVCVVNESGTPQPGVPVQYLEQTLSGTAGERERVITDANGHAQIRILDLTRFGGSRGEPYPLLALGFPDRRESTRLLDDVGTLPDLITLVMPATGSVVAEVRAFDGGPVPDGTPIVLQLRAVQAQGSHFAPFFWMTPRDHLRAAHGIVLGGLARFPRVGLGLNFEIGADYQRAERYEGKGFNGPVEAGEVVRLQLAQHVLLPEVRGRILLSKGVRGAQLSLPGTLVAVSADGDYWTDEVVLRTDASGNFRIALDPARTDGRWSRFTLMALSQSGGATYVASAVCDGDLRTGELRFGEILLGGPLLVAGVVVSPEGAPLRTAFGVIEARAVEEQELGWRLAAQHIRWHAGVDSRFEVYGAFPPGRYKILADAVDQPRSWQSAEAHFDSGDADVELRFGSHYLLTGNLILDPHIPTEHCSLLLRNGGHEVRGPLDKFRSGIWLKVPLVQGAPRVDLTIFGYGDGWPLLEMFDMATDRDQGLYVGRLNLRGQLGVATLGSGTTSGRLFRSVILFPEGSRSRYGYEVIKPGQPIVFRLDSPHCVASLPGVPLFDVVLRDGPFTLQD
ncbi:MAG: hypothetical protein O3A20_04130 [Planctomycetota bacterium]|nr:hypothetical protein [Planctomycetota bacterium]